MKIKKKQEIHFEYKIWQDPLYGSFVNLAYLKNFNHKIS
jgi:hypothetical protein